MKRILLLCTIVLSIGVLILAVLYPNFVAMARADYPGSNDPDKAAAGSASVPNGPATLVLDEPTKPQKSSSAAMPISVQVNRENDSALTLRDGRDLVTTYVGSKTKGRIEDGSARPLSLTAGDVDEDGVPDLVSGYSSDDANLLVIHRGNVDSIYPNTPEADERKANGEFSDAPFLSPARVFEVPERPDFIGSGDFNADGHRDIVVAALGGQRLYWSAGDGHGSLNEFQVIDLPGSVTAMTVGEINRADGLDDVVVGIANEEGTHALVFEGAEGALKREPEALTLPSAATSFALGQLDDSYEMDLAVAAGKNLMIVHGRDRRLSLDEESRSAVRPARIEQQSMPFAITSLAIGDFSGDRKSEIALLSSEGVVHVVGQRSGHHAWTADAAGIPTGAGTNVASCISGEEKTEACTKPVVVRARVSLTGDDDLLVVDPLDHRVEVITNDPAQKTDGVQGGFARPNLHVAASLDVADDPVAVLPMRLNIDGLSDLVVLKRGGDSPLASTMTAPTASFTVNNTGDQIDAVPGNGRCETVANNNQCTLRAAIQETNASIGADTISFSVASITTTSTLPNITDVVTIDGGTNRTEISGPGLTLTGGNSVIQRLVLNRLINNAAAGVSLSGKGGNRVEGCYIGTNAAGTATAFASSSAPGVSIDNSPSDIIGGTTTAARNVITAPGAVIRLFTKSPNTKVQGNYISTDAAGGISLGGDTSVSAVNNANDNPNLMVGGTDPGAGNVMGKVFFQGESGLVVQGNLMGTNKDGTAAFVTTGGNGAGVGNSNGVAVTGVTIGGTTPTARNTISGWGFAVQLINMTGALVQGNRIGTDKDGTKALGNAFGTQFSFGVTGSTLGGLVPGAGNLISGCKSGGATFSGSNNLGLGNYIGTDVNGTANLGNGGDGVVLSGNNNRLGGSESGAANIIAFNTSHGVNMFSGGNSVRQNSIFSNGTPGSAGGGILSFSKAPVLTSTGGAIQGTLTGAAPNVQHTIEFFSNPTCGADAQGKTYLDQTTVTTNASGAATFSGPAGQNVTATANTATTTDYGTSPFSNCAVVVADPIDILTLSNIAPPADSKVSEVDLKTSGLKAKVTYLVATKPNALLALRVFDQDGFLIGSSVVEQKARPNPTPTPLPTEDFFIPGVQTDCPDSTCSPIQLRRDATGELLSKTLTMQAYFIDPLNSTVIKRSSPVTYNVVTAVRLEGFEVTQAVQDLNNSVPLVADKPTFIRAYLTPSAGQTPGATISASLIGTNSNGVTDGILTPSNPGKKIKLVESPKRAVLQDSFYFELPANWIKAGTLQFKIQSPELNITCGEADAVKDCSTPVTFKKMKKLSINFIGVTWKDASDVSHAPALDDLVETAGEIQARFPMYEFDSEVSSTTITDNPCTVPLRTILDTINNLRTADISNGKSAKKYYMGLLPDQSTCGNFGSNGIAFRGGNASTVFLRRNGVVGTGFVAMPVMDGNARAHELSHNAGTRHTSSPGSAELDPATDYLPMDGFISIGRTEYGADTAFGFDIYNSNSNGDSSRIFGPTTYDFMSYARPRWVSVFNYNKLFNSIGVDTGTTASKADPDAIMVTQTVQVSGKISLGPETGTISPLFVKSTNTSISLPPAGAYEMRLETAAGQLLSSYTFDPETDSDGGLGSYSLALPWDSNAKRIRLMHNGQELASRVASANAPTIAVTSPNGGETLSGSTAAFTWTAADADGNSLAYSVDYSPDGGATWSALAVGLTSTTYTTDLTKLPASTQALIRVTASDGFNSTTDASNAVFTVSPHAPQASIISPENNHLYVGDQVITLNGLAADIEDGMLNGSRLSWSSSLNGALGTGSSLSINASTLTEGTHVITLTATDSTSRAGTATIPIRIFRTAPAFPATLAVGPSGLAFNASVGTVQAPPQTLAIRNNGDGALNWSATANQPWIKLASAGGAAPSNLTITADPTGLAPGQYAGSITIASTGVANSPQTVQVAFSVIPPVTVSGRVLTPDNHGLKNASVSLTDSFGVKRTVISNSFGLYSFGGVSVGGTYTIAVTSKRFRFTSQTLAVNGNLTLPDFVGLE